MTKIAVFGHSPDTFTNLQSIQYDIENAIEIIHRQHKDDPHTFLVNGEPGISQWFCNKLIEHQLPFEIFLSYQPYEISPFFSEEQRKQFEMHLNHAHAIHVCASVLTRESCSERDKNMIDASQWVLAFWNGKHQGFTYRAVEHALKTNKLVFNGINGITPIDLTQLYK